MATPKTKPAEDQVTSVQEQALAPAETLTTEQMRTYMTEVHLHLDGVELRLQQLREEIFSAPPGANTLPLPKVTRRRSQDEMDLALRRLLSPDPRPRDDDSPQVVEDCFAEVMNLRQLVSDLMQTMTGGYQSGLAAIRRMTEK